MSAITQIITAYIISAIDLIYTNNNRRNYIYQGFLIELIIAYIIASIIDSIIQSIIALI